MSATTATYPVWAYARSLVDTLWPRVLADDSESQRRRKIAVRSAQMAVVALVLIPVGMILASDFQRLTGSRVAILISTSVLYILWSLHGLREVVRRLFGKGKESLDPVVLTTHQGLVYFTVLLSLAAVICYYSANDQAKQLAWLVLLPPIAHSVILLRGLGVFLVSVASAAVLVGTVVALRGLELVPVAFTAFSFSVVFTLVFTSLTVSAEKSRLQVERLATELVEANSKLRQYAVHVEELAMTRERNRLAREVHDTLGHYLTVVNVQLEAARILKDRDPEKASESLAKARSLTLEGLQEIRRSVSALRASPLDNRSLTEALRHVVEEHSRSGLRAEFLVHGCARSLSPQAELTMYRAGQEGLTNVRKHAPGATATIELDFQHPKRVFLRIKDTGTLTAKAPGEGFGLTGLRERAQLLGGVLRARSVPQNGFILELEIPE